MKNLRFLGWSDPVASAYDPARLETVSLSDYYDPSGSGSIRLLWVANVTLWCGVCMSMYGALEQGKAAELEQRGVAIMGLLYQDDANPPEPATPDDLAVFAEKFSLRHALGLDLHNRLGAYADGDAVPAHILIDPRTMQLVDARLGGIDTMLEAIDQALAGLP